MVDEKLGDPGKFDPNHKWKDFSKETLLRIMNAWWKIAMQEDIWWNRLVTEKVDEATAKECDKLMWVKIAPQEIQWMKEALNITKDDVESFFKVIQNDIGFPEELFDHEFDLKNPNHGIITVNRCGGWDFYCHNKGQDYAMWLCHDLEMAAFDAYTHAFNPNIKVTALNLPPKKKPDDPICKWEFVLEK